MNEGMNELASINRLIEQTNKKTNDRTIDTSWQSIRKLILSKQAKLLIKYQLGKLTVVLQFGNNLYHSFLTLQIMEDF